MADNLGVSVFPVFAGNKLDVQWGMGRDILLAEVATGTGRQTEDSAFGNAQWRVLMPAMTNVCLDAFADLNVFNRDEPSSAQRQVAYDTMKLYRALHTQALRGESATALPFPCLLQ